MVVSCHGHGSGSDLCLGTRTSDVELHELIATQVSRVFLQDMPDMFGMMNEGMIEIMDECMWSILVKLRTGQFGACNLTFLHFHACGAPEFQGKKELVLSMRWIVDVEIAFLTIF